ncbi:uncharacterized protein E9232_006399 [Inquilinus ginsengisoli]|uniref:Lysozyme inhibitor LprI-like N-terminal domain-containing protein n=1 Tax=Inquilinus ginsengisoli TaxID=363840 RepID=A0ABU1JZ03_9PROT|nr:DUF1176 domain-containing protein [Inquilinus ginsengisoli]MDR6293846.1 uncharacterized protein [Inquilinus ginsengisoli]
MRHLVPIALAAACAAALPAWAAAQPSAPLYKEFKDWQIACDNGGRCEAKGFPKEDDADHLSVVRVTREPGPQGAIEITLEAEGRFAANGLALQGGGRLPAERWTDASSGDTDHRLVLRDQDGAATVLAALRGAQGLRLGNAGTVSLDGVTAALLAMDDAQGRVGTTTALVRPGDAPATTVPAAPALPVLNAPAPAPAALSAEAVQTLAAATRASQRAALSAGECFAEDKRDDAIALTATEALVQLQCIQGAYQSSYLFFRVPVRDPKAARQLVLPLPVGEPSSSFIDTDYDPAKGELTSSGRGRGPGDCGESAVWVFDGKDFQLRSFAMQDSCRGFPGDWPVLWRVAEPKAAAAAAAPAAAPAGARPSFDCSKAKAAAEVAICGSAELSQADAEIARLYSRLRGGLDDKAAAALKLDQQTFVMLRDDSFGDTVEADRLDDLGTRLRQRIAFLRKVKTGTPTGLAGAWGNGFGTIEIKPDAKNRLSVSIETVEQLAARWVCDVSGSGTESSGRLALKVDEGWGLTLSRDAAVLTVDELRPGGGDPSVSPPYCGANGSVAGAYLPLTGMPR